MFCFVSIKFHFQPVVIIWLLRFASEYYKDSLKEGKSFLFCQIKGNVKKKIFFLDLLLELGCSESIQKMLRDLFRVY